MDKIEKKRQKEQYVVEEMIKLYCRKNHSGKGWQAGDAVFGTKNAAVSSTACHMASGVQHERKEQKIGVTYDQNQTGGAFIPCKKVHCIYDIVAMGSTFVAGVGSFFDCSIAGAGNIRDCDSTGSGTDNRYLTAGCGHAVYL